jgi:hypothetical protein
MTMADMLPNASKAEVDIRKLRDYCLNLEHEEGKHKARLFLASLGMQTEHAEELREILLQTVKLYEVKPGRLDGFGPAIPNSKDYACHPPRSKLRG